MDNRSFDMYFNEEGILSTRSPDGSYDSGDGAQKTGLFRFGRFLKFKNAPEQIAREQAKYAQELDMLESKDQKGWYVRSPSIGRPWWSDRYSFSRDQQRSIVIAMGALKQTSRLYRIAWEHIKRVGWYQNFYHIDRKNELLPDWTIRLIPSLKGFKIPDIAAPDHIGEYIRAFWMAGQYHFGLLYPFLVFADFTKLIALPFSFKQWEDIDESDDDNLIISTLQAKVALPTPFSYLFRVLYRRYRPVAGYTDASHTTPLRNTEKTGGPASAIAWKHQPYSAPPYIQLYGPIIEENF